MHDLIAESIVHFYYNQILRATLTKFTEQCSYRIQAHLSNHLLERERKYIAVGEHAGRLQVLLKGLLFNLYTCSEMSFPYLLTRYLNASWIRLKTDTRNHRVELT